MTSLYDLPPEQQLELVEFARERLAEEKAERIREIEQKEHVLDQAETWLQEQNANPSPPHPGGWLVGDAWPAFTAWLVARPYSDHADYKPVWDC